MNLHTLNTALKSRTAVAAVTLLTLSAAGNPVFAQKGLDFGLKLNVQTSSLLNSADIAAGPELDFKNRTNVAFGVSGGYNFNKNMGAEVNILFSKQGQGYVGDASKINANSAGILSSDFHDLAVANDLPFAGSYTARIELTTIKIPLLFRFTSNNTKMLFFSSFIGPQINMLTGAKYYINDNEAKVTIGNKPEDDFNKVTIDGVLGLGAGYNINKNFVVSLHLRLDYGFSDIENKKNYDVARTASTNCYWWCTN
jgi:hypothetical protein